MANPNPKNPYEDLWRAYNRALNPETKPATRYIPKAIQPWLATAIETAERLGYKTEVYLDSDGDIKIQYVKMRSREVWR